VPRLDRSGLCLGVAIMILAIICQAMHFKKVLIYSKEIAGIHFSISNYTSCYVPASSVNFTRRFALGFFCLGILLAKEMILMKITRRLVKSIKGRIAWKNRSDDQIFCTETRCRVPKMMKGKIDQNIPARDRCFNISNCSL
jgi:hypothetical protein